MRRSRCPNSIWTQWTKKENTMSVQTTFNVGLIDEGGRRLLNAWKTKENLSRADVQIQFGRNRQRKAQGTKKTGRLLFGEGGEDEAIEGGGWFGDAERFGDEDSGYGLRFAGLGKVAVELGFVAACGGISLKTSLPFRQLSRIGIDSLDLRSQSLKISACFRLRLGGFVSIGAFDDIRLLDAITNAKNDFVTTAECAMNIRYGMRVIDLCHKLIIKQR